MAICDWCDQEMQNPATATCTGNTVVSFPDGKDRSPVPYVAEQITEEQWMADWRRVRVADDTEEEARKRMAEYFARGGRCHDCGIQDGGSHHPGCDAERCPRCKGQLISCGCLGDDD